MPGDEDADFSGEGISERRSLAGRESTVNQLGLVDQADADNTGSFWPAHAMLARSCSPRRPACPRDLAAGNPARFGGRRPLSLYIGVAGSHWLYLTALSPPDTEEATSGLGGPCSGLHSWVVCAARRFTAPPTGRRDVNAAALSQMRALTIHGRPGSSHERRVSRLGPIRAACASCAGPLYVVYILGMSTLETTS